MMRFYSKKSDNLVQFRNKIIYRKKNFTEIDLDEVAQRLDIDLSKKVVISNITSIKFDKDNKTYYFEISHKDNNDELNEVYDFLINHYKVLYNIC